MSDLLEQANRLEEDGNYQDALALFSQIGGSECEYGKGVCLYKLGRLEEARESLIECLCDPLTYDKAFALLQKLSQEQEVSGLTSISGPANLPKKESPPGTRPFLTTSTQFSPFFNRFPKVNELIWEPAQDRDDNISQIENVRGLTNWLIASSQIQTSFMGSEIPGKRLKSARRKTGLVITDKEEITALIHLGLLSGFLFTDQRLVSWGGAKGVQSIRYDQVGEVQFLDKATSKEVKAGRRDTSSQEEGATFDCGSSSTLGSSLCTFLREVSLFLIP